MVSMMDKEIYFPKSFNEQMAWIDEPGALPENEIYAYWNNYLQSYIAELETQHKNITGLLGKKADNIVKHEKVLINAFDEFAGRWYYDVSPEQLFWRRNTKADNFKIIECVIDSADMCTMMHYQNMEDMVKRR